MINPRQKGYRGEHALVRLLTGRNIECYRVPLSGSASGFKGDLIFYLNDKRMVGEVKVRHNAFKRIYDLIENYDIISGNLRITTLDRFLNNEQIQTTKLPEQKQLSVWIKNKDVLFFRTDRKHWLVAIPLKD